MRTFLWSVCFVIGASALGCRSESGTPPPAPTMGATAMPDPEKKIAANLAQLDAADRALAEAQRFCAVENDGRLGSMGPPVKVMVNDKPVFLCCDGCRDEALADPEKTLAKVESLKEINQAAVKK